MNVGRALVRLALVVAVAGCGGDDDPLNLNGSLSFDHSGGIAGAFNAAGRLPLSPDFSGSPWAVGSRDSQEGVVLVTALVPRAAARYDMVFVIIPRLTAGSVNILDVTGCGAGACAIVSVEFGASENDANVTQSCFLLSGTVALTSISQNRARGTFSGSGECTSATGTVTAFTVGNGSFDVPLLGDVPGIT
jgi:hypothetical protein